MKFIRILIILIVNAIFWSSINSVKNNKDKKELTRVEEISKDLTNNKVFNDGLKSSIDPQIQLLKPKSKIANKGITISNEEKKFEKNEYMKSYWRKNKEKRREFDRKYYQKNKEKKREYDRKYQKERERNRKYREKMKNKKENLKNVDPQVGNVHSDNNEGSSFVRNDFRDKGKLPIVYEEGIQHEEGNLLNQEEEECSEKETNLDEQNQSVVEEANMNQINLNVYPFDLNKKPEGEDEDFY
ncbi:unnamed protein product [Meloidogyne enterolobii]|uniref:Uncharacterized protein n=1 Tax=Meloidogyne enterolobii TaxID=390850 RepID=A0ACB0Y0C4_MELEN